MFRPQTSNARVGSAGAVKGDLDDISGLTIAAAVVGTGVVGTSVLLSAYVAPAPILGGIAAAGGCAYFGDKRSKELKAARKAKKDGIAPAKAETVEPKAETTTAPAAA